MDEAPRVRRNWPIWACKALPGFAGCPSPHSWSISRSALTGAPRLRARSASRARCLSPRTAIGSPSLVTTKSPKSFTSTTPPYDRCPRRARSS